MVIISDQHKYIFVHVPKNAGNSIWQGLLNYEENGNWLRYQRVLYMKLKYAFLQRLYLIPYSFTENSKIKAKMIANGHAKIYEIKDWLPEHTFNEYFKFGIVRNPWDRAVSLYSYHQYSPVVRKMTFKEYLLSQGARGALSQMDWFLEGSANQMNKIFKLEDLTDTLPEVLSSLGIENFQIGHRNKSKRSKDYQKFYDEESIELVRKYSSPEIEKFNYEY